MGHLDRMANDLQGIRHRARLWRRATSLRGVDIGATDETNKEIRSMSLKIDDVDQPKKAGFVITEVK